MLNFARRILDDGGQERVQLGDQPAIRFAVHERVSKVAENTFFTALKHFKEIIRHLRAVSLINKDVANCVHSEHEGSKRKK